jgi:phospholipase/carboxylesterase
MYSRFLHVWRAALLFLLLSCGDENSVAPAPKPGKEHLTATVQSTTTTVAPGFYNLSVAARDDAYLLVPNSVAGNSAVPLVVMLHGAGGTERAIEQIAALAEPFRFALLVPKSRQNTWDVVLDGFGEDVLLIDRALRETFSRVRVDPNHIALAGFSDGASYALTLGLANGNLFSHVIAFAPGFISPITRQGRPLIFIAHGRGDPVLRSTNTANNIVPFLRALGYTVRYDEFDGGHLVDPAEADSAFGWFLGVE